MYAQPPKQCLVRGAERGERGRGKGRERGSERERERERGREREIKRVRVRERESERETERESKLINRHTRASRQGHSGVGLSALLSLPRKFPSLGELIVN